MSKIKTLQKLILGSGSPRRKELFASVGLEFSVRAADINEAILPGEGPEDLVRRLALEKALAVGRLEPDSFVLAADTIVYIDQEILGKPADSIEACHMLARLQGRRHLVYGGIAVTQTDSKYQQVEVHQTEVEFQPLTDEMIRWYVGTGEPLDKAGAYGIQAYGSLLVRAVYGSYTNVVGLNFSAALQMLKQAGVITFE